MHKIRCPHCDVINLEQFITFPNCAGCGRTLPAVTADTLPFWRRSVHPIAWVLSVGVLLTGMLATASVFRVNGESQSQVVLYGERLRRCQLGHLATLNLRIDTLGETRAEHRRPLRNVQLRIPLRSLQTLRFVSISPQPDTMKIVGKGRYFEYDTLPRDSAIQLRFRTTETGRALLPITLFAEEHLPGFWRVSVKVLPAQTKSTPPLHNDGVSNAKRR